MSKNFGNKGGGTKSSKGNVTHVKGFGNNLKHNGGKFNNKNTQNKSKDKPGKAKDFDTWRESLKPDDKGKTNWNDLKTEMKTLREKRKQNKKQTFYDSYQKVKKIWEKLRLHTLKPEEKVQLCQQIMELIKGNIKMIIKSHDIARVIQWLIKLGDDEIREQIFTEISEDMVNLSKNKYTKHTIKSLIQHSTPEMKKKVVEKCYGNIYNLTCNKISAPLVDELYKVAGAEEKKAMVNEFFSGIASDITLSSEPIQDEVTKALLNKTSKFLSSIIDKGHCLDMHLIHSVIESYWKKSGNESGAALIEVLKPHFKSFITSKDGVTVFARILFQSTAKDKKNIVKEFKNDLVQIVTNEHSSLAFRLLIDSVDDTVLIKKALVLAIIENLDIIMRDPHGRKSILYLIVHRNKKFMSPSEIEWMAQWDGSQYSKKDSKQKIEEIHQGLLPPLIEKIKTNVNFWFENSSIAMVLLAILQKSKSQEDVLKSIAEFITDSKSCITENDKVVPVIEHPGAHMIIKKIIANDKEMEVKEDTFSYHLVDTLNTKIIERFVESNRGCFTLVAIFEISPENNNFTDDLIAELMKKLNKCTEIVNKQTSKGSEVLKKYMKNKSK